PSIHIWHFFKMQIPDITYIFNNLLQTSFWEVNLSLGKIVKISRSVRVIFPFPGFFTRFSKLDFSLVTQMKGVWFCKMDSPVCRSGFLKFLKTAS
ncbi:hypothetical protein O181_014874, partial [Austropuccinia psidii MF-1]|nr:hypothetical protein [Austropuccinia psidii MF-1]